MDNTIQLLNLTVAHSEGLISDERYERMLEYVSSLSAKDLPIIYNLRHLRKILKIRKWEQPYFWGDLRNKNYTSFFIPKKSGKWRKIEAPNDRLKEIQCWIKEKILEKLELSESAKGFRKSINILDNAIIHTNKKIVLNIDLKDFFPSIKYDQVFKVFYYAGYTKEVSHLLTKLCTNNENVLPQGAPTSPILSNIVCYKLDKRLSALSSKIGANYSRYADDITFSGNKNIVNFLFLIRKIINEERFIINEDKFRILYSNGKQTVTGLTVNKKVSVDKKLLKELENAIYFINKYGQADHMKHIECDRAFYKEHIYGIAYYVNMIDKDEGQKYINRLNQLNWDN